MPEVVADAGWAPVPADNGPRYRSVTDRIAATLARRKLRPGQALPAERDLAAMLGVSRTTLRRAIAELGARGLVTSRPGSGTYVAEHFDQPLARLSSFSEDVRARGLAPGSIWLERLIRRPLPEEALALALRLDEQVAALSRVRTADGEPLALERAVVPARLLPNPGAIEESLYAALGPHAPVRALQRLRAAAADAADGQRLGIPQASPVIATIRHGYCGDGQPVEYTTAVHRGDRYDFVVEMRRS